METPQTSAETLPHTVTVTVSRANGLRGRKADLQSFVQVELDGTALGRSETKAHDPSHDCCNYEFSCSFPCSRGPQAVAELARKLLIVTVFDFLPEEKKADARTSVLGQAVLDFLLLLHGQTNFSSRVAVRSGAAGQTRSLKTSSSALTPSLDVEVSVSEAVVCADALASCNLLRVTLETAFSVPDSWTSTAGVCTAALEVPVTAERNQMLVFCNGALKPGGVREEKGRPKKRPFLPQLLPANTVLPDAFVSESDSIEDEDGELTGDRDRSFRKEAETKKSRVSWDVETCCFLNGDATNRLRKTISKSRLWPLEIMMSMPGAKMLPEEEPHIPCHGVAFVDVGRLLFPGATRIRGAYCIQPFSHRLLLDKAKQSASVLKQHMKAAALEARCSSAAGVVKKASARKIKVDGVDGVTELNQTVNTEPELYLEARTYVMIEISLEKPLIPKTPPEELSRRVMALIPTNPPLPKGPTKAERAVQNYHRQVGSVVSHVCEQVGELYGADLSNVTREQMKAEVMGELSMSGRYFAFKEQIKHAVVRLVRHQMQKSKSTSDARERQELVSDLYTYLVDEMHVALNRIYGKAEVEEPTDGFHLTQSQVKHFATEAQCVGDNALALKYLQELLVRDPTNPENKFNLGSHYLLMGDYIIANEYFYDALATDPAHQPSLVMCGVLAFMLEHYAEAQTLLERAAALCTHAVEAWTLLGLLHQSQEEELLSERAFLEANKLLKDKMQPEERAETATQEAPPPDEQQTESIEESPSPESKNHTSEKVINRPTIYTETVGFLLHNYAPQILERTLAQELLSSGGHTELYLLQLARFHMLKKDYSKALVFLQEALESNDENAEAWALKGHAQFFLGSLSSAQQSYECSLSVLPPPQDLHLVLLRLGNVCQQQGQFEQAKEIHLQACEQSASCLTWLGLGAACYRLGELSLAESALTEANHLNNQNAHAWIYLSLVCLKSGRVKEAEQFYKYAQKFKLQNEVLLREYTELHEQARFSHLTHCFERVTTSSW